MRQLIEEICAKVMRESSQIWAQQKTESDVSPFVAKDKLVEAPGIEPGIPTTEHHILRELVASNKSEVTIKVTSIQQLVDLLSEYIDIKQGVSEATKAIIKAFLRDSLS